MPSIIPGNPIRSVQATASLGRLISTSKLPASESNDRRFVLDASSSISPSRGSMIGFHRSLQICAAVSSTAPIDYSGRPVSPHRNAQLVT